MLWQGNKSEKDGAQVIMNSDGVSPIESTGRTWSDGPSKKEPAMITSIWKIGWQTPTLMMSCYVLSLLIAGTHLFLFRFIHGMEASGPNEIIPQSYVSTISNILANAFGFALRAALAIAFCQYLWHLLRVSTMKVSTIELLFTIRTNLFMLFRTAVMRAAPVLCLLALLMWGSQVATSFPPGAITVSTAQRVTYNMISVPTFDASFMGNASGAAASENSLGNLFPAETGGGFAALIGSQGTKHRSLLPRIAFPVLVKGEAIVDVSPCGSNCSYTITFEGPHLECTNSSSMFRNVSDASLWEIYKGEWFDKRDSFFAPSQTTNYSVSHFNSTTLTPLEKNTTSTEVLVRMDKMTCFPGRSKYTVTNTYVNNIQNRTVTTERIDRLISLQPRTKGSMVIVPGFTANGSYGLGTDPAVWNEYALNFYRDLNHITIIGSMLSRLVGNVLAKSVTARELAIEDGITTNTGGTYLEDLKKSRIDKDVVWGQRQFRSDLLTCPGIDVSVIDSTRFNRNFGHFTAAEAANPDIVVTEELLNEHLFNLTVSMMSAFGTWPTLTNSTQYNTVNVYDFSSPLLLILPYFVSLALAIPFVVLGLWALWKNGVSAIDGSFMQIVTTTTGSAVLDKAAAGGCLGGDESVPQELKDLKIRFGEIIDREEPGRVKRAGFGVEGEVTSLKKGDSYGIARWI